MRRLAAIAGMLLTASACASPPQPEPPAPYAQPSAEPAPIATPAPPQKDACGAADLQGLIGHPRTEIPVPVQPDRQRVACTTCPVTQDYRPDRLNFFFDAGSGRIREIKCG
ncbi:MAG: hypothetical protein JWP50_2898 [Phenylobacterium sp.]|nr:hypothetical protein [Phenylobacterium sp.]